VNAVWEEVVELWGMRFVKQVDFKPGVKKRGSYGCGVIKQKRKK